MKAIDLLADLKVAPEGQESIKWIAPWLILGLVATQLAGVALGQSIFRMSGSATGQGLFAWLLCWDGNWYLDIGSHGYEWNALLGTSKQQNLAFFPVQGLIDAGLVMLCGGKATMFIILSSLLLGLLSIFRFESLARRILSPAAAQIATACFTFWPASSFYIMGYPTGLISICVISALIDHIDGRMWHSAGWLGLGTGGAPTVVFVGLALGLDHLVHCLRGDTKFRGLIRLAGWGLLALTGLIGFMLYQYLAFHDAFAFFKAQDAWGASPPLLGRLNSLLNIERYFRDIFVFIGMIFNGDQLIHTGQLRAGIYRIAFGVQDLINFCAFLTVIAGLITASKINRPGAKLIAVASWFVVLGYLFFIFPTPQSLTCVPRLLFPAMSVFLGIGSAYAERPQIARIVLVGSLAALSFLEAAFVTAHFWVI